MPADMIKYMPFRQFSAQNHSTSSATAAAAEDDVTARSDALRMPAESPDGASTVSAVYFGYRKDGTV